jgi:hypothetical protein
VVDEFCNVVEQTAPFRELAFNGGTPLLQTRDVGSSRNPAMCASDTPARRSKLISEAVGICDAA